jgi:selenide,water dikinase
VPTTSIKQNNTAREGDLLFLTKPLGVGILTTAEKKGILKPEHEGLAAEQMMQLNRVGEALGKLGSVHAMTDVTGFGLLGHLIEMAEGSDLSAEITVAAIPFITPDLPSYIMQKAVPGGTSRNWDSYGIKVDLHAASDVSRFILADPQTSGGLLIAVDPSDVANLEEILRAHQLGNFTTPIGRITAKNAHVVHLA